MTPQVRAVVWAQQRALLHSLRRGARPGSILAAVVIAAWYAGWLAASVLAAVAASREESGRLLAAYLPQVLFFATLYWQLTPVLLASQGAALELKRLLAFPIPPGQLFALELSLRTTTCVEMLLAMAGLATGLSLNPSLRAGAAPLSLALFVVFNLLLGAGLKYQLEGWLARRRLREALVLLLVVAAALPQLLTTVGAPAPLLAAAGLLWVRWWPWSLASEASLGPASSGDLWAAAAWLALVYVYGRCQFRRGLRPERVETAEAGTQRTARNGVSRLEAFYRLPSRLLPDPLAGVIEKELRSLVRTPRFRLLFLMGFSFGILIFLPLLLASRRGGTAPPYQLTMVCGYALLLLSDVLFWNVFGADRAAAQLYYLHPLSLRAVLAGKNLAAALFVALEITGVVAVWALLRMPLSFGRLAEAYAAPLVLAVYMMAMGNLASVYYPRRVNPEKAAGASADPAVRILLLLLLPVLAMPVLAAYGVRYVFRSEALFWTALGLAAVAGAALYRILLEAAAGKAEERKERLAETLSTGAGPIQMG
ncbi:MAG: hypothetical protein IT159_03145 [Bryobacterales bacterium]|nr:hypothetical protein [Bryobacterales bacterium]